MASEGSDGQHSAGYGEDREHFKLMFTGENKDFTHFDARFSLHVSARFGDLALALYLAEWQELGQDDEAHPAHVYYRLDIEAEANKYNHKDIDGESDDDDGERREEARIGATERTERRRDRRGNSRSTHRRDEPIKSERATRGDRARARGGDRVRRPWRAPPIARRAHLRRARA